jgi:hypothetical protein
MKTTKSLAAFLLLSILFFCGVVNASENIACNIDETKSLFETIEKTDQEVRSEFRKKNEIVVAEARQRGAPVDNAVFKELFRPMEEVDANNLVIFEKIVTDCGWPSYEKFGATPLYVAFLVVQHAPLEIQLKYFPFVEGDFKQGHLKANLYAMLVDRILMRQNKLQRYGPQSQISKDGVKTLFPVEDAAHLNDRLQAMGMKLNSDFPMPANSPTDTPKSDSVSGINAENSLKK